MEASARSAANGNRLELKMAAAQQRSYANKLARRQVLRSEISAVNAVKFVEKREVRACDLHINEVIHGHPRLFQDGLDLVEQDLDFVRDFGRRFAGFIQADATCQVERVSGENQECKTCPSIQRGLAIALHHVLLMLWRSCVAMTA